MPRFPQKKWMSVCSTNYTCHECQLDCKFGCILSIFGHSSIYFNILDKFHYYLQRLDFQASLNTRIVRIAKKIAIISFVWNLKCGLIYWHGKNNRCRACFGFYILNVASVFVMHFFDIPLIFPFFTKNILILFS